MLIEGCKHELEIIVPAEEIARESDRVVAGIQQKARMPGFRPGKTPASIIRSRFADKVRQDVLESLVPKYFQKKVQEEELQVVGPPSIKDIHFHDGEALHFKAEFEVAPVIELKEYRGVQVHYHEPEVTDDEVQKRLESLREQKAQYVNIDPRPAVDGDYAVVSLDSLSGEGLKEPIHQPEMTLQVGDPEKLPEFSEALRGMTPEEEGKEFDIAYPADYGEENLAGKTIRFRLKLKMLRTKELPELNDEFAKDLGDFDTLDSLREALRKVIFREKEAAEQQKAKEELIEKLVDDHDFAVPEVFIDRQTEAEAEAQIRHYTGRHVDMSKFRETVDWSALKEKLRPKAIRDVKATLLIDKVAETEGIHTTNDEMDKEVQRIARQEREPVAALRKKLEQNGTLGRIAHRIRSDKTIGFLFEHARKEV